MLVYLNGEYVARAEARVSVDDRGFIFGDGVYEVIRAIEGRLFTAAEHLARMEEGMRALGIPGTAETERATLLGIARRLLRENGLAAGEATVYLQVTRGAAPRAHHFPTATRSTVYLAANRFEPPRELRSRGGSAITHPDLRWSRCHLKTVNLLPNVLAKQAAVEAGAAEAILVRDGVVTEGSSTNVFGVIAGELRTHPATPQILHGITRSLVMGLAAEVGYQVVERPILQEELPLLEECFITGTTTDVLPIVSVDGLQVGDGAPGPVTRTLREALAGRLHALALAEAA
jgi:D-alanine transaminase